MNAPLALSLKPHQCSGQAWSRMWWLWTASLFGEQADVNSPLILFYWCVNQSVTSLFVLYRLGLCSMPCRKYSFWEQSRGRWWRSCRRLPSEKYPAPSGAPGRSTSLGWRETGKCKEVMEGQTSTQRGQDWSFTFARTKKRVAAKVCDLHHHAVVYNTVRGLQTTVHLNVTGMEIGHALQRIYTVEEKMRRFPTVAVR